MGQAAQPRPDSMEQLRLRPAFDDTPGDDADFFNVNDWLLYSEGCNINPPCASQGPMALCVTVSPPGRAVLLALEESLKRKVIFKTVFHDCCRNNGTIGFYLDTPRLVDSI